jgi:hypothetical protein
MLHPHSAKKPAVPEVFSQRVISFTVISISPLPNLILFALLFIGFNGKEITRNIRVYKTVMIVKADFEGDISQAKARGESNKTLRRITGKRLFLD